MGATVSNEGEACNAVVRFIEQRTGGVRCCVRRPETDHAGPPVDFRLKIGAVEYAIEHTLIETFTGEISAGVALEFFAPVKTALGGKLPGSGIYQVVFPTDPTLGVRRERLKYSQESLIGWIRENAPNLQQRPGGSRIPPIKGTPSGFPYEIELRYAATSRQGTSRLGAVRYLPPDQDSKADLLCQLQRALRRKLPKLHRCKCEGARTVLVLEDDGFPLRAEASPVGEALLELWQQLAGELSFPDEIYVVFAETGRWRVSRIKDDDRWWPGEDP